MAETDKEIVNYCLGIYVDYSTPYNIQCNRLASMYVLGHIHYSSQVHICIHYITGICQQGSNCDTHHCPLPYHWQYRLSLEGWKSFSDEDNRKIEELYCNPKNDIITSAEIDLAVKSYRET